MNLYVEMIDTTKDALGRQVFFLGWDDEGVSLLRRFQVFNDVLQKHIDKWVCRGYKVVYL